MSCESSIEVGRKVSPRIFQLFALEILLDKLKYTGHFRGSYKKKTEHNKYPKKFSRACLTSKGYFVFFGLF